ncbi:glycosyltransferase [Phocaeicola plebeius]|uniref:glycosyltransferase family 2 protein n=1 Tax=Phocaeicola plebeius TaxID=310297 RepID=UPI00320878A4
MNNDRPMVSIHCLAYNHEKTIRQTLESFVMQKTTFQFEAIIHDDASTDNTASIIQEYTEKYPNIIKPIFEKENQYSKHDGSLTRIMYEACTGKYIAYCEGDDYWTDPLKLQKQVDYLESHPEIVYSCCRFNVLNEFKKTLVLGYNKYFDNKLHEKETEFIFNQSYPYLEDWITLTLTQVIRRDAIDVKFRQQFKYNRDVHLIYSVLAHGNGVCHNFIGGVYRLSNASTFGKYSYAKQLKISYNVYEEFYRITKSKLIQTGMTRTFTKLLTNGVFMIPRHICELKSYPIAIFNIAKKYIKKILKN